MPITLGIQGSGVVAAIGSGVKTLKVGDEVYGGRFHRPALPVLYSGWIAEYTVVPEKFLLPKPPYMSFAEAASLLAETLTAYQSFRRGLELMGLSAPDQPSPLKGKTVFVPGALSATGLVGVQMAKNVLGASKVISTVSTPKMSLVEEHLPGVVDQLIDYKMQNVVQKVGRGTVDFMYNTQWDLIGRLPIMNPVTGVFVSIASAPPPALLDVVITGKKVPLLLAWLATLAQWWYDWKLRGTNVKRDFVSGDLSDRSDVERCGEILATGKIKGVVTLVSLDDLSGIRRKAGKVATGKGGIGKMVVEIR